MKAWLDYIYVSAKRLKDPDFGTAMTVYDNVMDVLDGL